MGKGALPWPVPASFTRPKAEKCLAGEQSSTAIRSWCVFLTQLRSSPSRSTRLPRATHCDVTVRYNFMAGKKQKRQKRLNVFCFYSNLLRGGEREDLSFFFFPLREKKAHAFSCECENSALKIPRRFYPKWISMNKEAQRSTILNPNALAYA